jgi:hypothetical protein
MTVADSQALCFQCHTEGVVQNNAISNNRPGGYNAGDDIEEAFSKSRKHNLGTAFNVNGKDYTLECVSCHNVHIITGKYWDAEQGKSPVTRFAGNSDGTPVTEIWGDGSGEKMDDFAAKGSGTGGFSYNIARGYDLGDTGLPSDQQAIYQPPKSGNGYEFEFDGNVLPDYTTFCLDCHSHRMSGAIPPVNWGQGIGCTDNSVDPPNQRIECGAQHGLGVAGKPSYVSDTGTAGFWGSSGNPDVMFHMNYVTRGRHNGHFMRWPYDSADRGAGVNFVMACTDCHEAHGSNRGGMVRERFNVNANGDCGAGGDPDPNGESCADGGNWNSYCNACHYYYGGQHAGMSCGNASCHEANSPHRIIHTTDSGAGTQLMLTAAGYEGNFQRPDFTPEIDTVTGHLGSDELEVTFRPSQGSTGIYANADLTGSLEPEDFWLFDASGHETRTITNVVHNAGDAFATLILSTALTVDDLNTSLIAAQPASIWSWYEGGYNNAATGIIAAQVVSAGPWPVAISGPPPVEISRVFYAGSQIHVIFSEGVYTNIGATGALEIADFVLNCSGRTIVSVEHTAGDDTAKLNLSSELDFSDVGACTVSAASNAVFDAYDKPVGTDPVTLSLSDECPTGSTSFQLDEDAGSIYAFDEQYRYVGTVSNPAVIFPGDGYYHGDENQGTYIEFNNNNTCFKEANTLTIEARIYANNVDLDYVDVNPANGIDDDYDAGGEFSQDGDGRNSTQHRIFERKRAIQFTLTRGNWAGDHVAARAGKAKVMVKYFVDTASRHTCPHPQWPEDTYTGNDARWHQISSDVDTYPVVDGHWYKIKVVFNSDKSGIPGSNGTPVDIFMDDQGENGNGLNENWTGYVNVSRTINESSTCRWGALPGDFMATEDQFSFIGDNFSHDDIPGDSSNQLFKGRVDWITWAPEADYSGVDDSPR